MFATPSCKESHWAEEHKAVCGLNFEDVKEQIRSGGARSTSGKVWLALYAVAARTISHARFPCRTWEFLSFITHVVPFRQTRFVYSPIARQWWRFLTHYSPFAWNPWFDGEWCLRVLSELLAGQVTVSTCSVKESTIFPGLQGSANSLPDLARLLNHSCEPNADWHFSELKGRHIITALRDIHKGEQVTISYLPPELPLAERQQNLYLRYGFHCDCILCKKESAQPPKLTKKQKQDQKQKRKEEEMLAQRLVQMTKLKPKRET